RLRARESVLALVVSCELPFTDGATSDLSGSLNWRNRDQRNGFFKSEKRSGSSPCEGCSRGASRDERLRAPDRAPIPGSLGVSRFEVAPRQRSSTAPTKCVS